MSKLYKNVFKMNDKIFAVTDEGKKSIIDYKPTIYVSSAKDRSHPWKTIYDETVFPIQPGSMKETDIFIENNKNITGMSVHGFTNYVSQFISDTYESDIEWNMDNLNIVAIDIETTAENRSMIESEKTTSTTSFPNWRDPVQEILLITLIDFKSKLPITFGSRVYTSDKTNYIYCENEKVLLSKFLDHWKTNYPDIITGWNSNFFDIPYVYHRMNKVLGKEITNQLSPFSVCKTCPPKSPAGKTFIRDGEDRNICVRLFGISNLDYLELIKKHSTSKFENYKLETIGQEVLGHAKLNHDEFEQFKDFYNGEPIPDKDGNEIQQLAYKRSLLEEVDPLRITFDNEIKQLSWNKFVDYNVIDTNLILDLEDNLAMLKLQVGIAYLAKINYEDVYSPVGMWESIIFNYLLKNKVTTPLPKHTSKGESFPGAFVKEPIVGRHKWIASFDLASLYPHIIMQNNVSPDTLTDIRLDYVDVDYLLDKKPLPNNELIKTASGWCFRKDKRGFLPELMDIYYKRRKAVRKEQLGIEQEVEKLKSEGKEYKFLSNKIIALHTEQLAIKVILNGCYGATGESNFLYFDIRLATTITLTGQLAIKWISNTFNNKLNLIAKTKDYDYVACIDTDSNYLLLDNIIQSSPVKDKSTEEIIDFMDSFCEKILQPVINDSYDNMATYTNAYENKMVMKREKLADIGIFHGKKKNIISVYDNEGVRYAKPKKAVTGLELVRSSTAAVVKKELTNLLDTVLYKTESELQRQVTEFKKEFMKMEVDDIAIPTGVNGVRSHDNLPASIYGSGTPINSRAALLHNFYIKEFNIDHKYERISEGDKIKYIYLNKKNPIKENVIGFKGKLPPEFDLHKYVDKELMFEKAFLNACNTLVAPLNWTAEEQSSLDEFFG